MRCLKNANKFYIALAAIFGSVILLSQGIIFAAKPPSGAIKFVISDVSDRSVEVNTPVTVTIEAQNDKNKKDTAYQNDVTLVASGSATGAGLVDIVDGIGTIVITDGTAEDVTLSLSDTQSICNAGPAIPKEEQDRLFKKFQRGEGAFTLQMGGTGLGLYFAKKAAEMNGGDIWFESTAEKGTIFYFSVPVV